MMQLRLFFCGTLASLDIRRRVPKILMASSAFSKILNLIETRSTSSSEKKVVASGVRVETCGPWRIASLIMSKEQRAPTAAKKSWDTKFDKRSVAGCWDVGCGGAIVGYWHDLMNSFKSGTDASLVRVTDAQWVTGSREVGTEEHW